MPNHVLRSPLAGAASLVIAAAGGAAAADLDRGVVHGGPLALQERGLAEIGRAGAWGAPPRPHGRPVNGGPGYVGSDYGLGKPAYTGLGSRPDWGFSE